MVRGEDQGVSLTHLPNAGKRKDVPTSEEDSDCDTELVSGDDDTTNLLGGDFGHVQDDDCRDETDTHTCDGTADDEEGDCRRRDLKNDTHHEDETASNDSVTATNSIGDITRDESAKECTGGENRHDQRLGGRGEDEIGYSNGIVGVWVGLVGIGVDGESSVQDSVDVSRVEAEKDASKSSKGAHEVGLEGNWGLGAAHVGRSRERAARHDGLIGCEGYGTNGRSKKKKNERLEEERVE